MKITHVGLPEDINLPFFAYGTFKPGQIAYNKIKGFCSDEPIKKVVEHEMLYRDGVPLIVGERNSHSSTRGFLMYFDNPQGAYNRLSKAQPEELFEWGVIDVDGTEANALIGKDPKKGSFDSEASLSSYDYRKDSFFTEARELIGECIGKYKSVENINMKDFFIIQMHYMLLWSVIERFCTFKYGYFPIGSNKFNFAREPVFNNQLKQVKREDMIYSSDTLDDAKLDSTDYEESIKYYYTIRCNVVHKGKTVEKADKMKLKSSLEELFGIFEAVYKDTLNQNNQERRRFHPINRE